MSEGRFSLSFLVDQLGGSVGGARFTSVFLRVLISEPNFLARLDTLFLLRTMDEPVEKLGALPPGVRVVSRRFPSRLRATRYASWISRSMPHARIGYGPFYYAFPRQGNNLVITAHDFSFLNSSFHPSTQIEKRFSEVSAVIQRCQAIVCTSDAMARECRRHFPQYAERVVRIYDGAEALRSPASRCHRLDLIGARPFILAVGTIEPRKNYDRLLDAYECLTALMGDQAPALVIVGRAGWMCESTVRRLTDLQDRGRVLWMQDASDDELADCYSRASIFSYLSAYEGFGYPPFEAAFFNVPMVLTQMSSVGEIWQGYAECVDPEDSASVASLWRKVLASSPEQKEAAVARQRYRAEQYGWKRCVSAYLELFGRLAASDAKSGEASN